MDAASRRPVIRWKEPEAGDIVRHNADRNWGRVTVAPVSSHHEFVNSVNRMCEVIAMDMGGVAPKLLLMPLSGRHKGPYCFDPKDVTVMAKAERTRPRGTP
jgi:hypothetical protein